MTDRPGSSTTYITGRNRARGEEHKAIYDY